MTSDATITCANLYVSWTNHAVKMHFAQLKIISECVNVNRAILAIRMSVAKLLTTAKVHLVQLAQLVAIIVDHSSVSASRDSLVILTIMDAKNLKNVKSTMTVQRQQNVSLKMDQISAKMFVRVSSVALTLSALRRIMQRNVSVTMVLKEILKIEQMDANRNHHHAQQTLTALATHIATVSYASQPV